MYYDEIPYAYVTHVALFTRYSHETNVFPSLCETVSDLGVGDLLLNEAKTRLSFFILKLRIRKSSYGNPSVKDGRN